MRKERFNENWLVETGVKDAFAALMAEEKGKPVTLPHDAMIEEKRSSDCQNGNQTGYYPSKSYTYTKDFYVPKEWENRTLRLEFEGVMSRAMVYINEEFVGSHKNGYSQFYINPETYLWYGKENTIKVIAINQEKSSRWYTGSGIYRDVNLWSGGKIYISPEGSRITTEQIEEEYAVLQIENAITNKTSRNQTVSLVVEVVDRKGNIVATGTHCVTLGADSTAKDRIRLTVTEPLLWNVDTPCLYTCRSRVLLEGEEQDAAEEKFGIRTLQLDARKGLRINGKHINLRGTCIHHDNGVIGATTLPMAEEYRCRKLKKAGFNAIRSAHHPMGKAMLRLCDELGMLVMDELTDMWNVPKNANDDALLFQDNWKQEVERIIAKDYNHPSVIMYSVGNEMPEVGRISGRIQCREIVNAFRFNDHTRYVTGGFNGFLALSGVSLEDGEEMAAQFAPSEMPQSQEKPKNDNDSEGSEKLNDVMGDIPYEVRDMLNSSDIMTRQLDEIGDELDIVGLNYMPVRHILEHQLHPDHVVVGSESYPTEIARLWEIVESNPHVLGDFTWTGYDYLGEAGIGIYHYDVMPEGQGVYPDRLAYCGDINLNGYRRPVSYLREIVYGLRKEPFIAVERVDRYGYGCLRNHWKWDDAVDSYTFPGYEGKSTRCKVLSAEAEVELFLNGKSLGRKAAGKEYGYTAAYEFIYEPGELLAVQYKDGQETGRFVLQTAKKVAHLKAEPTKTMVKANTRDLVVVEISLEDELGVPNMWEKKEVSISVDGPLELLGFGSANPSDEADYRDTKAVTYDGRLLAVLRSKGDVGKARVYFEAEQVPKEELTITLVEK